MGTQATLRRLVLALLLVFSLSAEAFGQPTGPSTISIGPDERRAEQNDPVAHEAQAGNVTALQITSIRVTSRWQGYYGNISGEITLDDAINNTLYSWNIADPEGELYAANNTVGDWSTVSCFNFSNSKNGDTHKVQRFNGTDLEMTLGMNPTDSDGVDETFNASYQGSFQVGTSVTINQASGCSLVSLFSDDAYTGLTFNETILTDNNSVIYTTLLEPDAIGFSGSTLDFQLIVGENGDTTQPTPYYFYIELS